MERTRIALDKIFEDKVHVPAALTACFAPTVCSNYGVGEGQPGLSKSGSNNSRHEALLKMEIDVKKNVSAVIQENVSLMTEGDEALLSALRERTAANYDDDDDEESISDSTNLNTIGEATLHDIENRSSNDISCKKSLPKIPGAYKQSIKSKFDHYRKHKQFNGGALQPINGNSENEGLISYTSENHDDDLISLATSQATDATSDDQKSSSRRNELAKQILKRRQSQPMTPSRTAIDP